MQHSNMRQKNEQLTVFSKGSSPVIKIFKVVPPDFSLVDITPVGATAINFFETYYKFTLTTPNEDCYLYMQYGGNGIILRVGAPAYTFFTVASSFQTGLTIPFRHISFDGDILMDHILDEIGEGLYFHHIDTGINDSFIEIEGFAYSIRAYPTASDQRVSFDFEVQTIELGITKEELPIVFTVEEC